MAQTVLELFEEQVHRSSVRPALKRFQDGVWEEMTWKGWWDAAERFAAGLMNRGVEAGDRVCLICSTRMEWVIADMGIAMAGAVSVPLHELSSRHQIGRVMQENQIALAVVEDPAQVEKVLAACEEVPSLRQVVYIDPDILVESEGMPGEVLRLDSVAIPPKIAVASKDEVSARGRASLAEDPRFVARRRREIRADTTATIHYTSGVTASPRGVVLTHANLGAQVESLAALELFCSDDVQLLFLPLAHIFSRVLYLAALAYGMTTVFGRGMSHLVEDLKETRPTLFASVPRVFERLRHDVLEELADGGVRARLLPGALRIGKAVRRRRQDGERVGLLLGWEHRLLSRVFREDVPKWLGGRMGFLICGGAPLDKEIAEFFYSAGVVLLEGYGMTETSGVVCCNMPDDFRFGSVGQPLPGVDVTIGEDSEILVRGRTVMKGYLGADGVVEAGVNEEGWFSTGDLGYFDRQGFLFLTGRKRKRLLLSTGIQVRQKGVEESLCEHPMIRYALLVGEGRPYITALIGLDPGGLIAFCEEEDIGADRPMRELINHPRVHQALRGHVDKINQRGSVSEAVERFAIVPEFFSVQNQALTASGDLRRSEVMRRWASLIEELYKGEAENF